MKRLIAGILFIILTVSLTGCHKNPWNGNNQGKLNYYIAGIYLRYYEHDDEVYRMTDENPKVYLDYLKNGSMSTNSGNIHSDGFSSLSNVSKTINDRLTSIANVTLHLPMTELPDSLILYAIFQDKNGGFSVDTVQYASVNAKAQSKYTLHALFEVTNQKYEIQMTIGFTVK